MEWLFTTEGWIAFFTLTALEVVLGVDNIIMIAILAERLPEKLAARARRVGLALAMISRILLLLSLSYLMRLTEPLFSLLGQGFSGQDLILISGGLFLMAKSALEIHNKIEGVNEHGKPIVHAKFLSVVTQIMILDVIFSLDSVITAVGMVNQIGIMVSAIVISVIFMMVFVNAVTRFLENRPTLKILALSFLLLVGMALVGEGLEMHIPRGYLYFAMAFSTLVELLNQRIRRPRRGV